MASVVRMKPLRPNVVIEKHVFIFGCRNNKPVLRIFYSSVFVEVLYGTKIKQMFLRNQSFSKGRSLTIGEINNRRGGVFKGLPRVLSHFYISIYISMFFDIFTE